MRSRVRIWILLVVALALGCSPSELRLYPVAPVEDPAALEATRAALQVRVQALGHANVSVELGSGPTFVVKMAPADAPPGLLRVLAAPGRVSFVPIPANAEPPREGAPIDPRWPALLGPDALVPGGAQVGAGPLTGAPTVQFRLTDAAAEVFQRHTGAHIGEFFAIVVDGTVVSVPTIRDEIPNGEVVIESGAGAEPAVNVEALAAYLASGPLPIVIAPLSP